MSRLCTECTRQNQKLKLLNGLNFPTWAVPKMLSNVSPLHTHTKMVEAAIQSFLELRRVNMDGCLVQLCGARSWQSASMQSLIFHAELCSLLACACKIKTKRNFRKEMFNLISWWQATAHLYKDGIHWWLLFWAFMTIDLHHFSERNMIYQIWIKTNRVESWSEKSCKNTYTLLKSPTG